jgi:DNA-binding winged helix-turn-helix (wHTH) protein
MPPKPREWIYLPRRTDLTRIFDAACSMDCLSVVGVSNLGKSATLRALCDPVVQAEYLDGDARDYLFVYIDFNQMLEMSDQAFYELVLRSSIESIRAQQINNGVLYAVEAAYTGLVAPISPFEVPLKFSQGMGAIGDQLEQKVVFLFDEVDGPVAGIDGRVFLNLRALRDRHRSGLTYVTATNRRLDQIRQDPDIAEFGELFEHDTLYLSMLNEAEVRQLATRYAEEEGVTFSEEDLKFIQVSTGGHPALLETTCRILGLLTGRPVREPSQDSIIHRRATEMLAQDLNVLGECRKIWNDLSESEHEALLAVVAGNEGVRGPGLDDVIAKHLVVASEQEYRIFARSFAEFAGRQNVSRRPASQGLRLDPDSGEVWVNGVKLPTLTNLEYRLLLLLYGKIGKIVDKYQVVEAVWGEDYIDDVDDARIEKLISRLRQKIERDPANPKYLFTVRGRGYKLAEG